MYRGILISTLILTVVAGLAFAAKPDTEVYLKFNLRYDAARNTASCINYQNGIIVPAGSKVRIISYNANKINFELPDKTRIVMEYQKKYTGIAVEAWLDRVTSPTDPSAEWKEFDETEMKGIKSGKALVGMRKEAVLVALGYPAAHRTPAIEHDRWVYWSNRFAEFGVVFSSNRVVDVGNAGR